MGRDRAVTTALLGAAVTVLVVLTGQVLGPDGALRGMPTPSASTDRATRPLRLPPTVSDPGGHTFLRTTAAGAPVTWDPCRPVHVVVRPTGEPAGGRELLVSALDEVGVAAGLVLVVDGDTDEAPSDGDREAVQDRYGDRWAPVLVAWSDPGEHTGLAGDTIGVAGPVEVDTGSGPRFVTGQVVLHAEWFAGRTTGVGARQARAVLLHELGHLVGLGHAADPFSLMSPQYQAVHDYALADRAGLARLGGGRCHTGT